ncbi:Polyferredoxin [Saccharicrinis carchari]|uniref:Polyferredoxin n=1 Tax=Saccharicrinis carchari TaxID=1168039 RepID=A0A521CP87_SACCC|nr:4Fe-4S binding protein [Saccharicrinis carchari]SMO60480.1 Polyferredoxin [Saccharicrinis carchari]
MPYSKLKKTRVLAALLFFSLTLFSFIDIYELLPEPVTSNILFLQFVPSLIKFTQVVSFATIGFIIVILLTVLLGRIYCSAICPLGILQDMFTHIARKRSKKRLFLKFKKPYPHVRYSLLALALISFLAGTSLLVNLLDPYSNAGRIFTYNIKPGVVWINNGIAGLLQGQKIYTLHLIELASTPWAITLYTVLFFVGIAYLSYKRGRLFCNLICPVGTLLGIISKKAMFKVQISSDKCTKCCNCVSVCKSECIDLKTHQIDYSRCVACYDCLPVCNDDAIRYALAQSNNNKTEPPTSEKKLNRRGAIATMLTITASSTILAQHGQGHGQGYGRRRGGFGNRPPFKLALREHPVTPPGSKSLERFNNLCTACGLCVSACPTHVLQPALTEYGLIGFMQPHMDYAHAGFCNFDCTRCSDICPTGAIMPLPIEEKKLTQLGKAVFVKRNCVVHRDGTDCGACSEHCPTKAVVMVPYRNGLVIPEVNQDLCIGCGACEYPCPVDYPHKAIYIESNPVHLMAQKPPEVQSEHRALEEDFPF